MSFVLEASPVGGVRVFDDELRIPDFGLLPFGTRTKFAAAIDLAD
ncbi:MULTISPECIES: hypothetical protein [unclassified Bradyrhizobium]|nr:MULTISPECIES: hypothetical protein [unclassified Bradyrhizobium]